MSQVRLIADTALAKENSNDRDERIREALEGLRERCAQEAERITGRRRTLAAMMNNEAVKPCEVAAAIRNVDVRQYYECAAKEKSNGH